MITSRVPTSFIFLVTAALTLNSCASSQKAAGSGGADSATAEKSNAGPESEGEIELSPGFLIQLSSPKDQKLNGSFRIQSDHALDLPYDVTIDTEGLNLAKLRVQLTERYNPYFKSSPALLVTIKQRRYYVEVAGGVAKPGTHLVKKDATLDDLISLSGGLTERVSAGFARIDQSGGITYVDLHDYFRGVGTDEIPAWKGGDRVTFQKERPEGDSAEMVGKGSLYRFRSVQVLGEVRNPGEITYRRGADAYYYLVRSGGTTSSSDLDRVELVRLNPKTKERETVALGAIGYMPAPKEGDLVIFHPYRVSKFEKALGFFVSIATIVSTVALLVIAL